MVINKRDRKALVISFFWLLFCIMISIEKGSTGILLSFPLIGYWVYRVKKNDISFINEK